MQCYIALGISSDMFLILCVYKCRDKLRNVEM